MPDKECTTNLLELSFSLGQLRADESKPREFLGEMSAILDGWECRKSGDDGKAFTALQGAIDSGSKGRGNNISKPQMDSIWKEYHSLMMAMGYLDLDLVGQPKRAPIPNTGIVDGKLVVENVRLKSGGFTDYRTVKTEKETTPAPAEGEPAAPATPRAPQPRTGRNMFMGQCLADATKGASQGGERMKNCSAEWRDMEKRKRNTWDKRAATANLAAGEPEPEAEGAAWGYGSEKKRRGASRWTPQNARNSILR